MKESDRIEENLRRSEHIFRTIAENSFAGIYMLDELGNFVFVNDRMCEMSGYARQELMGTDFRRLLAEEIQDMALDRYDRRLNGQILSSWSEIIGRRKDGSLIHLESSSMVVNDISGELRTLGQVFDITERKKTELSLKESEALNRSLLDATPAGVGLLVNGKIIKINNALLRISGYPENELLGQDISMLYFDEEEFTSTNGKLYEQMQSDGLGYAETRFKKKDGAVIYVILCLSSINCEDLSHGVTLTVLDITARKEAEYELKRIKCAVDSVTDAIGMASAQGHHFYQNQAFDRMFGYNVDEVASRHPMISYKDEHIGQEVFETIMSGNSWKGEVEIKTKDGRCLPVFLRADGVKDAEGKVVTLIGVHTDISERKKAEEQLRQSEEKYRNIFENAIEGIFQSTPEGYLLSANPAMARISGYDSTDEMVGTRSSFTHDVYVYPQERAQVMELLNRHGVIQSYEFEGYKKNKEIIWVSLNAHLIKDTHGRVTHIEGTVFDITDRKKSEIERLRLEAMLQHLQKIESIGRLAGGVAHDFNNLLTAIMGNTEMAMLMLDPAGKPYQLLSTAIKAAEGAAKLTSQLLVFSRKQVIEPKVVDVNNLIDHLANVLLTLIGENISLRVFPLANLHLIKVDPGQLEQIIINLAANARDAMPDGGTCTLSTANTYFDKCDIRDHPNLLPGEYVMITVRDTGCGMSREVMNHLYEPFFTTKDKGRGTGLGLATVYGIVQQNGGMIEVESELNQGTTFKVYFPKTTQELSVQPGNDCVTKLPHGGETILLVEDNEHVLKYTHNALKNLGYQVLVAAKGEDALDIVSTYKERIDLLMTDVILPGMNGRATAEAIRPQKPGIKILYHSGYTAEVIDKHGILEEGLHFLSKPFTIAALAVKVREVLDNP